MAKSYRVAIAGCGRMGKLHAVGYGNDPRCRIVAVADPQEARAAEMVTTGAPGAKVYGDYRQMLAAEKPDLVSLCLWTRLHLPAIRDCVKLGIPAVHCEKPMAPTWGDAQEIARLVRGSRTRLTFNHQRRFTPSYATARELLRSGEFGKLERIETWIPDNVLDWGTHLVDLTFYYNGDVPARWVMGQIDARKVGRWFDVPYEFAAEATIRFQNGVRASVRSGDDKEARLGVRLTCTGGIIEPYEEIDMRTLRYGGGPGAGASGQAGQWEHRQFEGGAADAGPGAVSALARHLIDTLASGQEPEVSVDKALRASEVIFALYESSRRRARIDLPLTITDNPLEAMLASGEIGPG
jgi:UDP-N-acetyl-2-amino-2-deoxyglucuronate dehydrogenase